MKDGFLAELVASSSAASRVLEDPCAIKEEVGCSGERGPIQALSSLAHIPFPSLFTLSYTQVLEAVFTTCIVQGEVFVFYSHTCPGV